MNKRKTYPNPFVLHFMMEMFMKNKKKRKK